MKRKLIGTVISDKMEKTRVVAVERVKVHPLYKKRFKSTKKYKVHDEKNESGLGDKVVIEETRPLSKEKRWKIASIIEKAKYPDQEQEKEENQP